MTSALIRKRFLEFFEKRGHVVIPSAPLVPENDPSVLFNTAGMQPLVPYLLGQKHPQGNRLVNLQKCVRTTDIDEVGDNTHLTFFEMMGNWSLGDYWKKESINWSYELLTNSPDLPTGDAGFGLDPQRLYVTCFEGDENAPKDDESAQIWKEIFKKNNVTGERIYFRPKKKNWWSVGENGPCGPDTEMFYDLTGNLNKGMTLDQYLKADEDQKIVEIWNNVFMEYLSKDGKVVDKLENRNVDTGAGFERMLATVQGKNNVFDIDLFGLLMSKLSVTPLEIKEKRITADHIRTSVFLMNDGVKPSNKDRGYILRRLLRRAWIIEYKYKLSPQIFEEFIIAIIDSYKTYYPELKKNKNAIINTYFAEWQQFKNSFESGMKELNKLKTINVEEAFRIFSSLGLPFEVIKDKFPHIARIDFEKELKKHQEISRAGAEQKFKGGLSGTGEMETKYHTATHLLHQALRDILGNTVEQRGSNITSERLRFDFTFDRKMTDEEKRRVEDVVNEKIEGNLPMNKVTMRKDDAEKIGALHFFGDKYGDEIDVYYIGDSLKEAFSKEFCGGPHVSNTGILGRFKIIKDEAISSGVRRIKAILE